jgi:hypothetical protein
MYLFDDLGDGIRMHKHDESHAHTIEVIGGVAMVYGPNGINKIVATEGQVIEIEWDKWHEIRAISPHTVIFNKYLNGYPSYLIGASEENMWANMGIILTHDLLEDGSLVMKDEWKTFLV